MPNRYVYFKNPRFYVMLALDCVMFALAFVAAHVLRFDLVQGFAYLRQADSVLPWVIPTKLLIFYALALYRGMWRYTSIEDLRRLAQASFLSTVLLIAAVAYLYRFEGFSRSVFLLDGIMTFLLTGGVRIAIRSWYGPRGGSRGLTAFFLPRSPKGGVNKKRVLIIGAGGSGEKMVREIFDNPRLNHLVVGFLDDDPSKWGRAIHGIPVLGAVDTLSEVTGRIPTDEVFISAPSATGKEMRRIIEICKSSRVPHKTLPAIGQIMDGKVSIKSLRDINYQDLLRRPPVKLDMSGMREYLFGRRILVTGAGGSIGSEFCRQLLPFQPQKLIMVDAGEANLYEIQMELRHEHNFHDQAAILARVQDHKIMEEVFNAHRPHVVFHAAAYKHVPMLERNPWEAVFTNIQGSRVVMKMAAGYGAQSFVLVSTDKAVRPTNVMGASKRLTEIMLQSMQSNTTRFMAVRFGNVLASSGSVVPLFRKQIERGGPVTVTHPEVTRYFMTIPEAVQLILQAGALGEGREIFILKMGTPVKILDMATDLIRLSGKEPEIDIKIVFTGLRAGEKLYEELITKGENITRTTHEKIMVLRSNDHWGDDETCTDGLPATLDKEIDELCDIASDHDPYAIKARLKHLVTDYTPQDSECVI